MSARTAITKPTGATVLSRALEANGEGVTPEGARFLLALGLREQDQRRTLDLLERRQRETITGEEQDELASYIEADNLLSILRASALLALKRAGQTP